MAKYLRTIGFTCKDGFCSASGSCDKYDDRMQDLDIQFDKVKFTLTPASYSYTKSGKCHIAVTSQPQDSSHIVLGNPFLIAFTTTLRMTENMAEFRVNPKAPPGVKFTTLVPADKRSKYLIFILIAVGLFVVIAIYALVTICMKRSKMDKANRDYSAVYAGSAPSSPSTMRMDNSSSKQVSRYKQ